MGEGVDVNYWVNRISHEFPISGALLRYGYLAVGWSDSAAEILKAADNGREAFKEQFEKTFPSISNEDCLWRFLHEYKIGDIVLVPFPDRDNNKFSIVEIHSRAVNSSIADLADIGFVRKVEHLKVDVPRNTLTEITDSDLFDCQKTTYSIAKHGDAIQSLLGDR
ncbi:MAG: hypothetical protein LBL83_12690 [Clostridiales bacterium]|jgi:predicted Mrr-cat superfamily restriction endonuclease|nr:hypothetical protein [Clostridiales bacterium]